MICHVEKRATYLHQTGDWVSDLVPTNLSARARRNYRANENPRGDIDQQLLLTLGFLRLYTTLLSFNHALLLGILVDLALGDVCLRDSAANP